MANSSSILLSKGRYQARLGEGPCDLTRAQTLRGLCFQTTGPDVDGLDGQCLHVLIETRDTGTLVGCFRMLQLSSGVEIYRSYTAQYYDLTGLSSYSGKMVELGRFCIHPDHTDGDILRLAWGAITRFVDDNAIEILFGCSSFSGTQPDDYREAFALLNRRHLAPDRWRPGVKAPEVARFPTDCTQVLDAQKAMVTMPSLLRTYLLMGGWVSDHAVVDRQLGTLHVFTGVEIGAIPAARKRVLRAVSN